MFKEDTKQVRVMRHMGGHTNFLRTTYIKDIVDSIEKDLVIKETD